MAISLQGSGSNSATKPQILIHIDYSSTRISLPYMSGGRRYYSAVLTANKGGSANRTTAGSGGTCTIASSSMASGYYSLATYSGVSGGTKGAAGSSFSSKSVNASIAHTSSSSYYYKVQTFGGYSSSTSGGPGGSGGGASAFAAANASTYCAAYGCGGAGGTEGSSYDSSAPAYSQAQIGGAGAVRIYY